MFWLNNQKLPQGKSLLKKEANPKKSMSKRRRRQSFEELTTLLDPSVLEVNMWLDKQ
jgi:hypothetical protein